MHSLYRRFLICFIFIFILFLGYIDREVAHAGEIYLAPGLYRLTRPVSGKKPLVNTNTPSKYAYVSYDSNQKITKIIFLPINGTWQNQKGLCQAYTNIEYIEKSYHFCSADLYKKQINIQNSHSFLWRDTNNIIGQYALVKPIPYVNSMYLAHSNHFKKSLLVEVGTYLAILSKTPNWYEVETISSLGKRNHGWIDRDSFLIFSFLPQKQETDQFNFNKELSDLSHVEVDTKNKIIKSNFAGDESTAVFYSQDIYNFLHGKIHLIQSSETLFINDDQTKTVTKTLVKGKWVTKSVISKQE